MTKTQKRNKKTGRFESKANKSSILVNRYTFPAPEKNTYEKTRKASLAFAKKLAKAGVPVITRETMVDRVAKKKSKSKTSKSKKETKSEQHQD